MINNAKNEITINQSLNLKKGKIISINFLIENLMEYPYYLLQIDSGKWDRLKMKYVFTIESEIHPKILELCSFFHIFQMEISKNR